MEKTSASFKIVVLGEGKSFFKSSSCIFPQGRFDSLPDFTLTHHNWLSRFCIARVGKTSLTLRFCKGSFDDKQISTIDASCLSQTISLASGMKAQLSIWDTAG